MVWVPTGKDAVANEAVLTLPALVRFTGLLALLPSITNWTVPVGVPLPALAVTVAVNVTL
jgi:hypothetical protein